MLHRIQAELVEHFGEPGRDLPPGLVDAYVREWPEWYLNDPLFADEGQVGAVLRHGQVYLSRVMMANNQLWVPGDAAAPAQVGYTRDETLLQQSDRFAYLLSHIYDVYHEPSEPVNPRTPSHQELLDGVEDGYARIHHERFPRDLAFGHIVHHASVMIHPHWFEARKLPCSYLPVFVGEDRALVLPQEWWPPSMARLIRP